MASAVRQPGNKYYVATIDDFVRALIQVSRYYQFLKGEYAGTGPGKKKLMLRVAQRLAQRSRNPKALNVAMAKMLRAEEFCTREPHFEGDEVFGFQKCKANIHLSSLLDRVNFSHPQVRTRSTRAGGSSCNLNDIPEEISPDLYDDSRRPDAATGQPTSIHNSKAPHVTTIQETTCKESEWHIARLPKMSSKTCFAQQVITKKKCAAKIVQDNKSTAVPTYSGMMVHYKKKKEELMQFFFGNDDIERCVKGTRQRWVKSRPDVPNI
jgi:hypothetical protein